MTPPEAVFDAMCDLQAVTNHDGPAWAAMALSDSGLLKIIASEETLKEVVDILSRPNLVKKFPSLIGRRGLFLSIIRTVAEVRPDPPKAVSLPRDPKDEPYLNLAVASGAAYLVTRDKNMLDLMMGGFPTKVRKLSQDLRLRLVTEPLRRGSGTRSGR